MELNKIKGLKSAFSSLKSLRFIAFIVVLVVSVSCTISYKFNGGNIDYTKTKSISIVDFANTAELVYAPLSQEFSEKLRDAYRKTTRLQLLKKGGDLHIEGEIVGYELTPMGIGLDSYAPQTKLTITINVRFTNNINPEDDLRTISRKNILPIIPSIAITRSQLSRMNCTKLLSTKW